MKLGVLGVGDLTEKMVRGLRRSGSDITIILSPRNRDRADGLARDLSCELRESNQAVADASDVLLIGVRPGQLEELASEVSLRPGQPLISVVIGVPVSDLQRLFGARDCSRAMLSAASEINRSTIAVFPAESIAAKLLAPLGNVVRLATERDFELATVGACINGWLYFLIHELQQWFCDKGFPPERAKDLVLSSIEDCAAYSRYQTSLSTGEIGASIAIPDTYTAQGMEVLSQLRANLAWRAACDRVFEQLIAKQG